MLHGSGFLALWNGIDPAREGEYDLWHTREHVPERVAVPGMLRARRYSDGDGGLLRYFTLYELESSAVLASPPYRQLLENPTDWSRAMRPSFRGFQRFGCETTVSVGGGIGGAAAAAMLNIAIATSDVALISRQALAAMLRLAPVTGAHLGLVDRSVEAVPFPTSGGGTDVSPDAILLLEGFERNALRHALAEVAALLQRAGLSTGEPVWSCYVLAYSVTRDELAHIAPYRRTP